MESIKHTRADYLQNNCTHEQYYSQFVNDTIKSRVKMFIGIKEIKLALSIDKNLNTIPLTEWDAIASNLFNVSKKMKLAGDYLTLSGGVCIAKEAARQLINE